MSKYTTELRFLVQQGYNLGLDLYPIFDESYRAVLNKKIINHFYFREIGFETPARFRHYLIAKLEEIMPYYNQLFQSQTIAINPLYTVDYTESSTKSTTGETESNDKRESTGNANFTTNRKTENDALSVDSDTPAGLLSIGNIKTNTYASRATLLDDAQTTSGADASTSINIDAGESSTQITTEDEYIRRVIGNNSGRSQAVLLKEYRESFLNIDRLILDELNNLFIGVF